MVVSTEASAVSCGAISGNTGGCEAEALPIGPGYGGVKRPLIGPETGEDNGEKWMSVRLKHCRGTFYCSSWRFWTPVDPGGCLDLKTENPLVV
ncbi:unnamed protein product [Boreogadus saida]